MEAIYNIPFDSTSWNAKNGISKHRVQLTFFFSSNYDTKHGGTRFSFRTHHSLMYIICMRQIKVHLWQEPRTNGFSLLCSAWFIHLSAAPSCINRARREEIQGWHNRIIQTCAATAALHTSKLIASVTAQSYIHIYDLGHSRCALQLNSIWISNFTVHATI